MTRLPAKYSTTTGMNSVAFASPRTMTLDDDHDQEKEKTSSFAMFDSDLIHSGAANDKTKSAEVCGSFICI